MDKLVYSTKDISTLLSISMNKVYELLHENRIPYVKVGKKFIIPKKAFETWLNDCANLAV
jgi:excisionase family DNA binding protein